MLFCRYNVIKLFSEVLVMRLVQQSSLRHQQVQKMMLSQSMQQSVMMLQQDNLSLLTFLKEKSMENPLFEVRSNIERYYETRLMKENYQIKDDSESLFDALLTQVSLINCDEHTRSVVRYLIQQLDSNGYLECDEQELMATLAITKVQFDDGLKLLQSLEPIGIGARSLQESLLIQLADKQDNQTAKRILIKCYSELINKEWEKIQKKLKLSQQNVLQGLRLIQQLTPYPAQQYQQVSTPYIVPELIVKRDGQALSVHLNQAGKIRLIFDNESYEQIVKDNHQEVNEYLYLKQREYQELEASLKRRGATIELVGRSIVERQHAFFTQQSTVLKPLLLKDLANKLELSESTISRAIRGKYVQTEFGIFELSRFFAKKSYAANQVNANLSVDQVLMLIRTLIEEEDSSKPLSDERLVQLLAERQLVLARRTVAKYRKQLGIPNAHGRKLLKLDGGAI